MWNTYEIAAYAIATETVGEYERHVERAAGGLALSAGVMGREELFEFVKGELSSRCPKAVAFLGGSRADELVGMAVDRFAMRDW